MDTSPARKSFIRDTSATDVHIDPRPRLKLRRRWLLGTALGAALLLAGAVLAARSWLATGIVVPRERVRIAEVVRGSFVRDVAAEGTVITANSPTLFAPSTGTVTFNVRAGDAVRKGQALATLDSPSLVNEFAQERATLDSLDVGLERQGIEVRRQELQNKEETDLAGVQIHAARREFKRAASAWGMHVIPERDYARASDDVDSAQLTYDHAVANAKLADESLQFELRTKRLERDRQRLLVENLARKVKDLTIRSPVDGIVGALAVNQRSAVTENAALLSVVDLSALEIEFRVPETYASGLRPGLASQITYGGSTYAGAVSAVSPEVEESEVKGRVRFAGQVPADLRENERVNVRIILDSRRDVLKVERGGFVDAGGIAYLLEGDRAIRHKVKLGAMSVSEVEILSGLAPGDRIIVSSLADFADAPEVRLSD
ncbi:MAG TPA: efflux RND transporter periplasmic adaptor subunit [Steroidobacteraceae bacterium]|nr:efflux RND transporter periplasmic adaptor subunit [Steroidobacteraceae bacterium]